MQKIALTAIVPHDATPAQIAEILTSTADNAAEQIRSTERAADLYQRRGNPDKWSVRLEPVDL